jgi:hypothetical protein
MPASPPENAAHGAASTRLPTARSSSDLRARWFIGNGTTFPQVVLVAHRYDDAIDARRAAIIWLRERAISATSNPPLLFRFMVVLPRCSLDSRFSKTLRRRESSPGLAKSSVWRLPALASVERLNQPLCPEKSAESAFPLLPSLVTQTAASADHRPRGTASVGWASRRQCASRVGKIVHARRPRRTNRADDLVHPTIGC